MTTQTTSRRPTGAAAPAGFGGLDAFPGNAIAYAQVRLAGGWRNLTVTGGLYALILGGAIVAAVRVIDLPAAQICDVLLRLLLGVQAGLLLLVGGSRVAGAVRNDLNGGMIESHRLMPLGPGRAVAGYLLGSTAQMLVLAALTLVAGVPVAVGAAVDPAAWLAANGMVALFAAFVWTVLASLAFAFRSPLGWLALPALVLWISQGYLLTAVPAVGLLVGPLIGRTAFAFAPVGGPMLTAYAASAAAQVAVGAVCFAVARRQYARGDAVGLSPGLGLALVATFALASWAGTALEADVRPVFLRRPPGLLVQVVCSLLLLMLLAQLPMAAAAKLEGEWGRRRARDPDAAGRRPLPVPAVAVLAGVAVAASAWLMLHAATAPGPVYRGGVLLPPPEELPPAGGLAIPVGLTGAVAVAALLAAGCAVRLAGRLGRPGRPGGSGKPRRAAGGAGVLGWFFLAWVGPVLADVIRLAQSSAGGSRDGLGLLSACSPIGAIILIWRDALDLEAAGGLPAAGLAVQAGVAVLLAVLAYAPGSPRGRASAARGTGG